MYATFYSITSGAAHTGMHALRKHLEINAIGKPIRILHGPSDENARMYLTSAADFVLQSARYICELLKIDKRKEIGLFLERLAKLQTATSE